MKKNTTISLAFGCILALFASCSSDAEVHQLSPFSASTVHFADQLVDSLQFLTTDSWTAQSQNDWISTKGVTSGTVANSYGTRYFVTVPIEMKPNATGRTRTGSVVVNSHEFSFNMPFVQLGILEITHPAFTAEKWLDVSRGIPAEASFVLTDSAHWTVDSLCFNVHGNWDLEFAEQPNPDWIAVDKSTDLPGRYKVNLSLTPNTDTGNGREAKLRLTTDVSGGERISNTITMRQLPAVVK